MSEESEGASAPGVDQFDIDQLLAISPAEQIQLLQSAQVYNAAGLSQLLDRAEELIGNNPMQARALAQLCEDLSAAFGAAEVTPRALYLRAQTHAITAESTLALELIDQARQGYLDLGRAFDAQRTTSGRIHALCELGRHQEALEAGYAALTFLQENTSDVSISAAERSRLAGSLNNNLATCYEETGRYDAALVAYDAAERQLIAANQPGLVGFVKMDRGVVLLALGQVQEALQSFEAAAELIDNNDHVLVAQLLLNRATALLQIGRYAEALALFVRARQSLTALQASADEGVLLLDMADAYQTLNLFSEALSAYRSAHQLLSAAEMPRERARTLWGLGATLVAVQQYEEASLVLAESAAIFEQAHNVPMQCEVMLQQAALFMAKDDRGGAIARARQALALVSRGNWHVQQARAHILLADLVSPTSPDVISHLNSAQRLVDQFALPDLSAQVRERLGRVYARQGRLAEAEQVLIETLKDVERRRGSLTNSRMRSSFAQGRHTSYDDLTQLYLARGREGDVVRAFAIAERGKSRALADMMRGPVNATVLGGNVQQVARARALRVELDKLYTAILQATADDAAELEIQHLRTIEIEQLLSQLQLEMDAADFAAAPASALTEPIVLKDSRMQLAENTAMVFYTICDDEIVVFVITRNDIKVVRLACQTENINVLLQRLGMQWERMQQDTTLLQRHMARLTQSADAVLQELYTLLIQPIVGLLGALDITNNAKLVIVPHGILHQVPFHALFDGTQYLLDLFEVSYAPSITVYALCAQQPYLPIEKPLIVGVSDARTPAAELEARQIAQNFTNPRLFTAESASITAIQSNLKDCGVIHIAAHGMFRSDNPMFSALKLHDGWLLATDIAQSAMPGALVTLSACESGRASVLGGDEVMGLTRAFLGAGAASVVASLWLAHDQATLELMRDWYHRMHAGEGRSSALRSAQLAIREKYRHPFFLGTVCVDWKRMIWQDYEVTVCEVVHVGNHPQNFCMLT